MINILPHKYKKMVDQVLFLRVITVTIWALIVLLAVAALLLIPLLVSVNARYKIANDGIGKLEKEGVVVKEVDVAALKARTETLAQKLAAKLPPAPTVYIAAIRSLPAPGIVLSGFAMEHADVPSLSITGTASSREALQTFVAAIERKEGVASVESPVSNYVKSTNSPFTVTVTFK